MANENRQQAAITPAQSLETLGKLPYEPERTDEESEIRRAELMQSVLTITRIDQVAESQLVRDAVRNALGRIPDSGE
jgi:hypothetical protein